MNKSKDGKEVDPLKILKMKLRQDFSNKLKGSSTMRDAWTDSSSTVLFLWLKYGNKINYICLIRPKSKIHTFNSLIFLPFVILIWIYPDNHTSIFDCWIQAYFSQSDEEGVKNKWLFLYMMISSIHIINI